MIRPFTLLCAALAGTCGLHLYAEKHRTTVLDQQISNIVQDTQHVRERTAMLRAQWAVLNEPDRLQKLAARFLPQLQPMDPSQFVEMTALTQHLPRLEQPAAPMSVALNDADTALPALMPQTVMARSLSTAVVAGTQAGRASDMAEAAPEYGAQAAPAGRHAINAARRERTELHAPSEREMPAGRLVSWQGLPRIGLSARGAGQVHVLPILTPWRSVAPQSMTSAGGRGMRASASGGSALGFARGSIAAPVPVGGIE